MIKRIKGFTLAETLITLIIVGIIAAITVPSLINNIQKNELRSQFNKVVRVTAEVVQKMKLDYGDSIYSNSDDTVGNFRDKFMSYFQVICKENCLNTSKYKNYANLKDKCMYFFRNCFIAQDGVTYCFYKGTSANIYITIDINGPNKKPNRWGYDSFTFFVPFKEQILKPCGIRVPTGEMKCDKTSNLHNGSGCAAEAIYNPNYFKNL